ncbi:biopolymer transporter ExbD [Prosthecobacter sp.]|uniref:ExbD/TolR family protein n=1 Tax=Prosthecobacter sp. TaxID=1965333 RepID=UPI001D87BDCD|nr:biopolymer transporter ExbD [Prosthecobacter sp.]MCB1277689.1 biopolymer transporter ExbD [Prosthecobacter sp.]
MNSLTIKHRVRSDDFTLGFQIAPMIDVVFVILLFFMVMGGTLRVERQLNTKLPGPEHDLTDVRFPDAEITIGILEDGTVTLNEEAFDSPGDKSLPRLTRTLNRLAASSARQNQTVLVTIQAEEQASYERVIDVLNSLHQAQIQNVTFTVGAQPL